MAFPAEKARYTFADVLAWDENERVEIIGGEAVMMAPPTRSHQKVSGEIFRQLANFFSPSMRRHDRLVKPGLYQRAGVREYWIVSPEEQAVQVLLLEDGKLLPHEDYGRDDVAKVNALDGCFIELGKVFAE